MHILVGGTGHVGSALAETLLRRGQAVTVVTRNASRAAPLAALGARVAEADIADTARLRGILQGGRRAFLLNPPGDPSTDTDAAEARSIDLLLAAIDGSGLERIVAQSTYGAQAGTAIGDLGTLHRLEQGLAQQPIPVAINRAAYYMSNWDMSLDTARDGGTIMSFLPADFELAMVAPADMGEAAADLMMADEPRTGIHYVEGPARYTANEVAGAFARALGRRVEVAVVPRDEWVETFEGMGFSPEAARSFAGMTGLTLDGAAPVPPGVHRGRVTLDDYIAGLVAKT